MTRSRTWQGTEYCTYVSSCPEQGDPRAVMWTILVVDPYPDLLQSTASLLDAYGYHCLMASSQQQALATLQQHSVDLLLTDMPSGNHRLLQQVWMQYPGTDVIVVSNQHCFENAAKAMRYGAADFIKKPYRPEELIRAIERVTRRRRSQRKQQMAAQTLLSSEQQHRFIVNNSPDIIYMLDGRGYFQFINERCTSLLGYQPEELLGCHYSKIIYPEDLDKAKHTLDERRRGERASHYAELRLAARPTPDSPQRDPITVELNAMGVYNEDAEASFVGTYGVIRDISARKQAEALVNQQLNHDVLTKLPNRALFMDRLNIAVAQARRTGSRLAVMYLDMDRFKVINDSLGHLIGDQLLQGVSETLQACIRDTDTLARVGGDEFNLLLPNINHPQDAEVIASKILSRLDQPMPVDDLELYISFSIGIAIYPDHGEDMDTLLKHADAAMYYVKEHGKKGFEFYQPDMQTKHSRHLTLDKGLRQAVSDQQLRLHFQPQVDVFSGETQSFEALVRWQHPQNGLVLPGDFLPLAEENGLITGIGHWVLDEACQALRRWHQQGNTGLRLNINVSARELVQADFAERILTTLARYKLPGQALEIEISENVLMRHLDQSLGKLKTLSEQGVRLAVDDFGTGYASLGYLQALPLNTLKIDASFIQQVRNPSDNNTVIFAIISMAQGLGLDLIAEGVETEAQLEFLRKVNCPSAQGYLTGRPQPAEQAQAYLLSAVTS